MDRHRHHRHQLRRRPLAKLSCYRAELLTLSEHSAEDYMPDSFGLDFVARETGVDLDAVSSRPTWELLETEYRVLLENLLRARLRS